MLIPVPDVAPAEIVLLPPKGTVCRVNAVDAGELIVMDEPVPLVARIVPVELSTCKYTSGALTDRLVFADTSCPIYIAVFAPDVDNETVLAAAPVLNCTELLPAPLMVNLRV